MLCRFRIKNYKSYRDEAVFDMQAGKIEEFSDSLIPAPCDKFSALLPVAAIYGPNSGGKSNLINGICYLISRILVPIRTSTGYNNPLSTFSVRFSPFRFDDQTCNEPTEFEIVFRTSSAQYQYELSILNDKIVEESLSYMKTPCQRRRNVVLFTRHKEEIFLGSELRKANTQQVSEKIPYLSFLNINYSFCSIDDAINWFKNCLMVDYAEIGRDHKFSSLLEDESIKPIVLQILEGMDIPVSDFEFRKEKDADGQQRIEAFTTHTVGDRKYQLNFLDESEGTKKLFSVLPAVVVSLALGGVLIIDELDAKLHPQLLRGLLRLFTDPQKNVHRAQMIFTCHDLSIMKNDLLRRDEIWFAAQKEDNSSELWSLYDLRDENGERVKNTSAYDKQYLAGRYGARPYLRMLLDWGVLNGEKSKKA